jgi:choline dehydrogenase-like flavoprotein
MADFDVVIVGAGIAGGLAADSLAKAGLKVIVLEAGPNNQSRGPLMKRYYSTPIRTPESPYENEPMAPRPEVIALDDYYVQKGELKFMSTYERRVGGTTWHWLGTCVRLLPNDFKLKTTYGHGLDWPISYQDLEPWYGKAEQELGVAGDDDWDHGAPRSTAYPKRPITQTFLDRHIGQACETAEFDGKPLKVGPTPQARDPDLCIGSTSCIPLCPTGAKYEATRHLNRAKAQGAVIQDKSVASRVHVGSDGKVQSIEYKTWDGVTHTVTGRMYILSANAIETPKLLLMSKSDAFPNGVANGSDQVGRNLTDHPVQLSWGLARKAVFPFRGPLSTSGIETLRDGAFRKDRAAFRIEIGNDGWSWPTGAPASTAADFVGKGLFGTKLRNAVRDHVTRQVRLCSLVEQLGDPNNRIVPSADKMDALGIPRPEVTFNVGAYEKAGLEAAKKAHQLVFDRLETTEAHHHTEIFGAGHIMGTCRMGASKQDSVVDANLRSHDHDNLYILGSSVFPTVGTGNPTLTIAALALRTASVIAKALQG